MTDRSNVRFPVWERQDWESDEMWGAFQHYRNTPAILRSLDRTSSETYVPFRKLQRWHSEERWLDRAMACDRYTDARAIQNLAHSEEVELIRKKRLELTAMAADIVRDELMALRRQQAKRSESGGDYSILKPHEVIRMMKEPMLLERLLLGQSTDNVSVRSEAGKLAGLSEDELDSLDKLTAKLDAKAIETSGKEIKH